MVLGRARPDADESDIDAGLDGIARLRSPGQLAMAVGRDVGLRAAGWTFAITNDWVDGAAHHGYDVDPEQRLS